MPSEPSKSEDVKEARQPKVRKQKANSQKDKAKEKSPTSFEFGLSKTAMNDVKPSAEFNFGLAKADVSSNPKSSKTNKNVTNNVPLDILNLQEPETTEELPEGPTIDLDAPVEPSKPVLLISKTEAEDLEDWLDSVLDD